VTQRQNIFGFVVLSSIFIGWLVYSELKPLDSGKTDTSDNLIDSDKDGVIDAKDKCPYEAGEINLFGCPNADTDGDGLKDKDENERGTDPNTKDSDGDGVDDNADACPKEKGFKENKGCPKKEIAPSPAEDFDDNKKVDITYKGDTYTIKRGFTSEKGMLYNKNKWRYYQGKWQKQEVNDASGKWTKIKEADINHILKNCATKKKKLEKEENGKTLAPPNPPADNFTTDADYQALKNLYNEILLRSDLGENMKNEDFQLWNRTYTKIIKGKLIAKEHLNITRWNKFILNSTP
jgi:hypothetical protein